MTYGLKEIARDLIAGKLLLSEAELSEERIKVCEACPHMGRALRKCDLCQCQLDLKTKVLLASCPIDKW